MMKNFEKKLTPPKSDSLCVKIGLCELEMLNLGIKHFVSTFVNEGDVDFSNCDYIVVADCI